MKRQVKYLILFFVITLIGGAKPVFASPPLPAPVCQINGVIKSVTYKDAYENPCQKEPNGCPTDTELNHPPRYYLDIYIRSVSYVSGESNFITCENMYPVGSVRNIYIDADKIKIGDKFFVNQKIKGIVRSFWGSSFDSYVLKTKTIKPVKKTVPSSINRR